MYKLFVVEGEPSSGSYMFSYVRTITVLAIDKQSAIQYAVGVDGLLGDPDGWTITEVMLDCPGVVDYSYTKDY